MDKTDLQALYLRGTVTRPVLDLLAVLLLDNRLNMLSFHVGTLFLFFIFWRSCFRSWIQQELISLRAIEDDFICLSFVVSDL